MPEIIAGFELQSDALPGDTVAQGFEAFEAISEPYAITVRFTSTDAAFRVSDLLRTRLCLVVTHMRGEQRLFDGVCDEARFVGSVSGQHQFEVRLRPAMAALAHREGCRIFQEMSVVDVVHQVLREAGVERIELRLKETYEKRELIVQYRESHLAFVSRLLEDEGIFYFFRHEDDGHTLILADDSAAFTPEDGGEPVAFSMTQGDGGDSLVHFDRRRSLRTSAVQMVDYDFVRPAAPPVASLPAKDAWPMPYYEYPGGFTDSAVGQRRAKARMRELRADADVVMGLSRAAHLSVGVPFSVGGSAEDCLSGDFVVTKLRTTGKRSQTGGEENDVENSFEGIPAGAPFAAKRRTKRPRIRGVQTAIVTGPVKDAEAIHTERYGRVKVRFFWDRVSQQDDTSSPWIRVIQPMLGGGMILPRIGWEVAVAFLDGDPDHPVVLGRVYNAEKVPPMSLPASKTGGALRSMTSPGGAGQNHIQFEDSGGKQGFDIHAQKDLNLTILHDKVEEVAVDESTQIKVNLSDTVKVNRSATVGGDQTLAIGANGTQNITGNQSTSVGGNDTSNATADEVEQIAGSRTYAVGANQLTISTGIEFSVSGDMKRQVATAEVVATPSTLSDKIVGSIDEKVGAVKVLLVNGSIGEKAGGDKSSTYAGAEAHLTKGKLSFDVGSTVMQLIGGLHYQKIGKDLTVKAPMITLVGAMGSFKGGGSELKLGGGPIVLKASKIAVTSALNAKLSSSMKLG